MRTGFRGMTDIQLRLLGAHRLEARGDVVALKTKRSWALLAYMVVNRDRAVPREEIAALLWDRSPEEQARASLRQELSSLRGLLRKVGWEPLTSSKAYVAFDGGKAAIDLVEFETKARRNQDAFPHYGGPFLRDLSIPSDPFTRWQDGERTRLAGLAVENEIDRLGPEGAGSGEMDAAAVARAILTIEPSNERAWREVMRHYANTGRRAEALRQYEKCARMLEQELDARPSPATRALAEQIRADHLPDRVPDRAAVAPTEQAAEPSFAQPPPPRIGPLAGRRRRAWLLVGGASLATVALGGAALGGVQYYADGQRYTQHNVLCAVPLLRPAARTPVTIGAILPLDQEHGKRLMWGFRKFLRDPPERYDFAFRIVYGDSRGGIDAIPPILADFENKDVRAVVGPLESRKAWDIKRWGNAHRVPVVSPLASASYLTGVGGKDFFFRVSMSDGERAKALVGWLRARNLHNNPYVIHETPKEPQEPGEPQIYGASQATAAKRHLQKVETIRFVRGDERTQKTAADSVRNDGRAVLIFGYTSNIIHIVHRLQRNGVQNPIFLMGVVQKRLEDANFPFAERLHVVDWVQSEARDFGDARRLRQEYLDEAPPAVEYDPSAYYPYDTLQMVLGAVRRAKADKCGGRITGDDIAAELRRTPAKRRKVIHRGFMPATQEIHYEWDGLRIVDGRFRPVGMSE